MGQAGWDRTDSDSEATPTGGTAPPMGPGFSIVGNGVPQPWGRKLTNDGRAAFGENKVVGQSLNKKQQLSPLMEPRMETSTDGIEEWKVTVGLWQVKG